MDHSSTVHRCDKMLVTRSGTINECTPISRLDVIRKRALVLLPINKKFETLPRLKTKSLQQGILSWQSSKSFTVVSVELFSFALTSLRSSNFQSQSWRWSIG